jgi:hypothetical protein
MPCFEPCPVADESDPRRFSGRVKAVIRGYTRTLLPISVIEPLGLERGSTNQIPGGFLQGCAVPSQPVVRRQNSPGSIMAIL